MSDANRTRILYVAESSLGETPATPTMKTFDLTSESMGYAINRVSSNTIRSDRNVRDLVQVSAEARGDLSFELSHGALDDFLESVMFNSWGSALSITGSSGDVSTEATGNKLTSTTSGKFTSIEEGQWIKLSGFTGNNNGYFYVETKNSNQDLSLAGGTVTNETPAGSSATITGAMLRNGTTQKSFTIEKGFLDQGEFFQFRGMVADQMSLNLSANDIISGSVSFLGLSHTNTSTTVANAVTAATGNDVLNAVSNFGNLREGGAASSESVTGLRLSIANNLRGLDAVGNLGHVDIGAGRFTVGGSFTVYFEDASLYDKYLADTITSLDFRLMDAAGNAYIITVPQMKLMNGRVLAGGVDRDVLAEFDFQAFGSSHSLQIDRFSAA